MAGDIPQVHRKMTTLALTGMDAERGGKMPDTIEEIDCYDWVGCPGTCDECEIGADMGIEQVPLPPSPVSP